MAKPKIPRHLNRDNLIRISAILVDVEHFLFFGGLLGFVRDGDMIEGDDDIDIYVNLKDREKILSLLKSTDFEIDLGSWPNDTPYFLQATKYVDGVETLIEFYFYEEKTNSQFVLERWNFVGSVNKVNTHLLIPKDILFPIKKAAFFDTNISLLANPEMVCEYLYGSKWRSPLSKGEQYYTLIVNNRPLVFFGVRGKILYKILKIIKKIKLFKI